MDLFIDVVIAISAEVFCKQIVQVVVETGVLVSKPHLISFCYFIRAGATELDR